MTRTWTSLAHLVIPAMLLVVTPAFAQSPAPKTLKTTDKAELGTFLTDGAGLSLYLFEEDRRGGDRGRPVETDCFDDCLERWPPLIVETPPPAEGEADASLIDSFERPDGKMQATYNGWPLYYFVEDLVPGDVNGHDIEEFGGEWYLLTPEGHELGEERDG